MHNSRNDYPVEPFIKKIYTNKDHYIYDINSNEILQVNKTIYDVIEDIGRLDSESILRKYGKYYTKYEIKKNIEIIEKAKEEKGYFSSDRPIISFGIDSAQSIKNYLSSGLQQLILEITERCNQRCKYCAFSGRYSEKRKHGTRDIPIDIAKKAIDLFSERSGGNPTRKPSISFYGGEPLMRFNLIVAIIEYIKKTGTFNDFRFSITSNGTLLSEKVIRYFILNNIFISISLDGPKHIHDRYRVFRNGKGSYDVILKNVNKIKSFSEEYFSNNISFIPILAPPYSFDVIDDYFYKNPLFQKFSDRIQINFVDPYGTSFFRDFNLEKEEVYSNEERAELFEKYKNALIQGTCNELAIERKLFDRDFFDIYTRKMTRLPDLYPPRGTCFPGKRRLFVNTEGNFYICEKVGRNYSIGNVVKGFDYERIYQFHREYEKFFSDCKNCWALRLCTKCYDNVRKGDELDNERKKEMCAKKLKKIENTLIAYCNVLEKNKSAFKPFDKIKVL